MATTRTRKKLTAAEKARVRLLAQEARAERLLRQVEARADQWEGIALREANAGRPPWRICTNLPLSAYEAKRCNRYMADR